ncbi:Odorant receptor 25 [Cephus cinctus]
MHGQDDFDRAANIMTWNHWLLAMLGFWPEKPRDIWFWINFGYFAYHMTMEYVDLFLFIGNLEHVIMNLTENMAFSQIFIRMLMMRVYNRQLGELIMEMRKDFQAHNYRSVDEQKIFLSYNSKSKTFMKLLMAFVALTASSYYLKPILGNLGNDPIESESTNSTLTFELPYRFYLLYNVNDTHTYMITYLSHLPFVFVSGFGQSAADCLMVTLVFHVCGQLSVLTLRISSINSDPSQCSQNIKDVVVTHQRLLRMGQTIDKAFSAILLGHLVGATSLVCVLGYQILTNFAHGQNADLATFLTFAFLVLLVLYAHCTVGESLVQESTRVYEAWYDCNWYNMPTENARLIILCMSRSQKPLCLTSGKFGIFCLSTLTDVLKTAMAYLSVLRSFL